MKSITLKILLLGIICFSCGEANKKVDSGEDDKSQLKNVVIQVLKWHDENGALKGFEAVFSPEDSLTGMNLQALQTELDNFWKTEFFDKEFIENYEKIVKAIDAKIKNKEISFMSDEMPPYAGADPWCNCQDVPYENPWDKIEVKVLSLEKEDAELTWTWGDSEWSKDFNYKVKLKKSNGTWKISYMEGFDFNAMTKL